MSASTTADLWVGAQPVTGVATLHGYGRIAWHEVIAALPGASVAWADYDGFHVGDVPTASPPYSHLWAWTNQWLLRARIEGDHAIVATLRPTPTGAAITAPVAHWPVLLTEEVRYTHLETRTWPTGEQRVGPLGPDVAARPADLYHLSGEHPVTFIRLRPPTAGAE